MKLKRWAYLTVTQFWGRSTSQRYMSTKGWSADFDDKRFIFVRHGQTEMNERLQSMPWYSENFVDGALWDTRLTPAGIQQAKEGHRKLLNNQNDDIKLHEVEVVLSSPLTRTLHTAELVFYDEKNLLPEVPKIAHPLLRERLYLSSEVGRCSSELIEEFPGWDLSSIVPGRPWWYVHYGTAQSGQAPVFQKDPRIYLRNHSTIVDAQSSAMSMDGWYLRRRDGDADRSEYSPYVEWRPEGRYCCEGEPKPVFTERIAKLREYLLGRPERCLAVVTHWGVLKALTGREFENCEVQVVRASELLPVPDITDE